MTKLAAAAIFLAVVTGACAQTSSGSWSGELTPASEPTPEPEPSPAPAPLPTKMAKAGAAMAVFTIQADFDKIAGNATVKAAFEKAFAKDMATHLEVDEDRVIVLELTKGSIKVKFAVQPGSDGKEVDTAVITSKLKKGDKVKLTTLAADPIVKAADPNIPSESTVSTDITVTISQGPCKEGGSTTCADTTCADSGDTFTCTCKAPKTGTATGKKATCVTETVKLAGAFSASVNAVVLVAGALLAY